jgi:hypothetical protein
MGYVSTGSYYMLYQRLQDHRGCNGDAGNVICSALALSGLALAGAGLALATSTAVLRKEEISKSGRNS